MTITEPNANAPITIESNKFSPQFGGVDDADLVIKHNYNSTSPVMIEGNTFSVPSSSIGLLSAASDNTFGPVAGSTNTVDVDIDTMIPSSSQPLASTLFPNSINLTGNTFNAGSDNNAIAIEIANHDAGAISSDFGSIVVGGPGSAANSFDDNLADFIDEAPPTSTVSFSGDIYSGSKVHAGNVPVNIDASQNDFGPSTGNYYQIEDKIIDGIDYNGAGLVTINNGSLYVTSNSFVAPATTDAGAIQRAIGLASSGNTVNIESGGYTEANVAINKPLMIIGQSESGVVISPSGTDGHAADTTDAGSIQGFIVQAANVSIEDLTLDGGAGQNFHQGILADSNFGWTGGNGGDLTVQDVTLDNIFRKGIALYSRSSLTAGNSITDNTFNDVATSSINSFEAAAAIADFSSSGTISGNVVTDSGAGILTNYLDGVAADEPSLIVSNNQFSSPATGMGAGHPAVGLDLSGLAAGSDVFGNAVNLTGGGSDLGIVVQYDNAGLIVHNNSITADGQDVAIEIYNDSNAAKPATIDNNTLVGTSSDTGILLTDDGVLFGDTPNVGTTYATLTDNSLTGFGAGVSLASSGNTVSATIGGVGLSQANMITGGSTAVLIGANTTASVVDNTITNAITGISVAGTATIIGDAIHGNSFGIAFTLGGAGSVAGVNFNGALDDGSDLFINPSAATVTDGGTNTFAGSSDYIVDLSANYLDATGDTFGSVIPADSTLADLYSVESKVVDGLDIPGNVYGAAGAGLVRIRANEIILAQSSEDTSLGGAAGSIQRAVDLADLGPKTAGRDSIYVQAGTYSGTIAISKSVQLLGANASADPTNAGARSTESIIDPSVSGGSPYSNSPTFLIEVLSSNVTIAGFILTGQNDALGTISNSNAVQLTESSVYAQAAEGIALFNPANIPSADIAGGTGVIAANATPSNIVIENNIVEDLSYQALDLGWDTSGSIPTSGNIVSHNLIQNIGAENDEGDGIRLRQNFYADVIDNQMLNVRMGVETGNYYLPNSGSEGSIANNEIQARRRGIFYNLTYSTATAMPVTDNVITAAADDLSLHGSYWVGVYIISQQGTVAPAFSGNTVDGSGSDYSTTVGYATADTWSTADVTISGGTVSNVTDGVLASNIDPNGFTAAEQAGSISISGVNISASEVGIYVEYQSSNAFGISITVEGNTQITSTGPSGIGVEVSGADASVTFTDAAGSPSATISGNSVGVQVDGGTAAVDYATLSDNVTGIKINSDSSTVTANHDSISGGVTGVDIASDTSATVSNTSINDPSGDGVDIFGTAALSNDSITHNGVGVVVENGGTLTANNDYIANNSADGIEILGTATLSFDTVTANGVGVEVGSGGSLISAENNAITGNSGDGILIDSAATSVGPIADNDLSGNGGVGVDNLSGAIVDASLNYWGVTTETAVALETSGAVGYTPWLSTGTDISQTDGNGFVGNYNVLNVGSGGPPSSGRINQAIADQEAADPMDPRTINVYNGLYSEDVAITEAVTLQAAAGQTNVVIAGDTAHDAVAVDNAGVTVKNLTIEGGSGRWSMSISTLAGAIILGNLFEGLGLGNVETADASNTITGNTFTAPPTSSESDFEQYTDSEAGRDQDGEITGILASNSFNRGVSVFNSTTGYLRTIWADIQPAIDNSTTVAGDTVAALAGTYREDVTVDKQIVLDGAGDGSNPAVDTVITAVGSSDDVVTVVASGADATHMLTVENVYVTGGAAGIYFDSAVSDIALDNVTIAGAANEGIEIHNSAVVTDLNLDNVSASTSGSGGDGFRVATTGVVDGLTILDSDFDNNAYGLYTNADVNQSNNQNSFTNVQITGTTFSHDSQRAIYAEKLNDATFDDITVNASGTVSGANAIDINLKYGTYAGLEFENSTVTASGSQFALSIKGRNDGSYASNPGSLAGVTLNNDAISGLATDLDIENNTSGVTFTGMQLNGSGLGLENVATAGQTLNLGDTTFAGSLLAFIADPSANPIDATNAKFGAVGPTDNALADIYGVEDKIVDAIDVPGFGLVRLRAGNVYVTPNSFYVPAGTSAPSIQRGINAGSIGDTVNVEAGTYNGDVNVNKRITLEGAQEGVAATGRSGAESIVNSPDGTTELVISVSDATVSGFTIQGNTNGNVFGAGAWMEPGISGTQFLDNIVQNNIIGLDLTNLSATDQAVIDGNLFQNNTNSGPGSGSDIYADQYTAGAGGVNDVLIQDNTFTNTSFVESSWGVGLSDTGVTPFTDITVTGNTVTDSGRGMYFYNSSGVTINDNAVSGATHYAVGLFGADGMPNNSSFAITQNTFDENGTGILVEDGGDPGSPAFAGGTLYIANNFLDNNSEAVDITQYALASGTTVDVNINSIAGNTTAGLEDDSTAVAVNADNDWWGSANGPNTSLNTYHPNNPAGDAVVGSDLTIAPWLADGNDSDMSVPGFQHAPASSITPAAPSAPDLASIDDSFAAGTSFSGDTGLGTNSDNYTNISRPTFIGTSSSAEAGDSVTLYDTDGTTVLGNSIVASDGTWSITSSLLTDGSHTIRAKVTDGSGNQSTASDAVTVVIDTTPATAPAAPTLTTASDSFAAGTGFSGDTGLGTNSDNYTNDTTPMFTGTAEAGSLVRLYANGAEVGDVVATDGTWSITSATLTDGLYSITATATDKAGNTSSVSSSLSITVDTTPPTAPAAPTLTTASDSFAAGTGFSGDTGLGTNSDNYTNDTTPMFTGTAGSTSYDTSLVLSGLAASGPATQSIISLPFGNQIFDSQVLTNGTFAIYGSVNLPGGYGVHPASAQLLLSGALTDNEIFGADGSRSAAVFSTQVNYTGGLIYSALIAGGGSPTDDGSFNLSLTGLSPLGIKESSGTMQPPSLSGRLTIGGPMMPRTAASISSKPSSSRRTRSWPS